MHRMNTWEKKRKIARGIARTLSVSLLFGVIGSHAEAWTIMAQAQENADEYDYSMVEGGGVLSLSANNYAVIKADGSLWMWGSNGSGQLGNGTTVSSYVPIKVMDDVKAVDIGDNFCAAIKADGSLWMWGNNSYGQLGNGITDNSTIPVKIMDNVKAVDVHLSNSAAIKNDGSLWMWGDNSHGQLGNGTTTDSTIPVKILDNVKAVYNRVCPQAAIKTDGSLWMWGGGYIGNGSTGEYHNTSSTIPIKIMDDVKTIAVDDNTAAIKTDGSLWMWGPSFYGSSGSAVPVKMMDNVKMVNTVNDGYNHSAAIKTDGSLWMWGNNDSGQLGNGTREDSNIPIIIMNDVKTMALECGYSAVIKKDNSLWMWGSNSFGQLGNGTREDSNIPIQIMEDVEMVAVKKPSPWGYSAAIKTDGSLWMWGANVEQGYGTMKVTPTPIEIMPAGSVLIPGISPFNPDKLPIDTEISSKPQIKVVDAKGNSIADAEITYNGKTFKTSEKGIAELDNYAKGYQLVIKKDQYKTKTIDSFVKSKVGRTTYILNAEQEQKDGTNSAEQIIVTQGNSSTDMLTKDAYINVHDKNAEFSIKCNYNEPYEKYILYAGDKKIAESSDGNFSNLRCGSFKVGQQISLGVQEKERGTISKRNLNIQAVDLDPTAYEFSLGENISIEIPDDAPILGGQKVELCLGNSPIEFKMCTDGQIQVGINLGELAKEDTEWFSILKQLNKDNLAKEFSKIKKGIKGGFGTDFDVKVIGYAEGNVLTRDNLHGKIFVELSAEGAKEIQGNIYGVPVVIEVSIEGQLNADGSISYTAVKGFYGPELSVGGEFALGLYGGVGLQNLISGGIYGKAGVGIQGTFFPEDNRGLDELYVQGEAGVKGKVFGNDIATWKLIDGKYIIFPSDKRGWAKSFAIDNDKVYAQLARNYLESDGSMSDWALSSQINIDGSLSETALQSSTCLDMIPQVVRMGDTVMLFYLTDAGVERSAANRSMLVYSLWDKESENWSEPKAVLDDGTADFAPDLYSDGEKIYAVWQNATENLTEGLTLNETAERLMLHVAVYDEAQDQFVDLGALNSENGLFQQSPQIVADGNEVSVYWYENAEDNVLGLSGTNRIYRAVLENAENAAQQAAVQSVEDTLTISGNDLDSASAFRKFVALEEETDQSEEEVTEPDIPEEEEKVEESKPSEEESVESEEESDQQVSDEETGESDQEVTAEETEESISENTISENSISENTLQTMTYAVENGATQPWNISFVQTEEQCIISADAGKSNGKTGYAYAVGKLDSQLGVSQGRVIFLAQDGTSISAGEGETGSVAFTPVYSNETLTWYQNGDIHYLAENDTETALFGESRLPSSTYTLISDGAGRSEVIFPVNMDGKANLYRISGIDGEFPTALQVTDQENYIQYTDGFIDGNQTILVYNRMKVNDALEEVNNSLCTGKLAHSYSDIVLQNAGSMVRQEEESGENVLEVTAQLYNNGTEKTENVSLTLAKADGTVLETVPVDGVLESGETAYVSANFALEEITEEADYTVFVTAPEDNNAENNSVQIRLGAASIQVNAQLISVADKRTLQIGIQNIGVTACGGIISIRDTETEKEYCNSDFEPIAIGQTVFAEIEIDQSVFDQKDVVVLEVVVTPDVEGVDTVSDFVTAYAPTYMVNFVTDAEESTVYVGYGKTVEFPANPVKDGAYFTGWYDTQDAAGGTLYTEETPIKSDVTLYARFVQEQTSIPLENCSVSEIPIQLYTGKALKPSVTVKWGSEVLKANKDYTLSYQNNKEQGTAKVTITGKGKYTGSITRNFLIKYDMNKVSVSKIPAVNFTGENHTPSVTVTYNKKTLVKNTDYTVTYSNNRNAGTAGITLTGKGKYSGTKTVTFQIKGTAITGMVFEKIPDVPYNGSASRPIVTVKTKDGTQLQVGADYRLAYENTVNKGTATVTVIGNGNYTGTKKLTYKVVAKPLTEAMISGIEDAVYTGSPIKPAVTVKDGGGELAAGKDYTVSYSRNKAVGTATVTVKGKGNYSGTVKLSFAINPMDLAQAQTAGKIDVRVNDTAYTGRALKPAVQIYEKVDGKEKKIPAGGYTLSYTNNTEMGTGTVTVTGKGSYTGTVTAQFRIVEKAKLITSLKVGKIADAIYTGTAIEPDVTITDGTYTLVKDTDYELSYKNQYNAGKATVTVRGIGSYAGSKDVSYKISKRAVGNKAVLGEGFEIGQISDGKYTGYALKPDIVVKDQGRTLVPGTDYKLSYRNNTKIGTASVTLTGLGNYSGSYNAVRFNIVSWDYNDLRAQIGDQVYTGRALKPQVTFYTGGEAVALKAGTAVKVIYKDNKNAGTATATITGKGELKNMTPITVSFEIEPADITEAVVKKIPNQTLKGVAVTPVPKVKVGKSNLKVGRDFTVSYLRNGVKGEAQVIITGTGNYTGECRKSFVVQ